MLNLNIKCISSVIPHVREAVVACKISPQQSTGLLRITMSMGLTMGILLSVAPGVGTSEVKSDQQCVVLLHGMARTARSMKSMAVALHKAEFLTVNIGYPSRHHEADTLTELAVGQGLRDCKARSSLPAAFVTHSLGGILLRYHMEKYPETRIGRVVMLGPPNQGSQVVDRLKNMPGFTAFNGPVGRRLGTERSDLPRSLGKVKFDLGVIAGTRSINPILSQLLPNPDDGKVSVANTRVDGMCDFIRLPVTHALMMKNRRVFTQTVSFLSTGRFQHSTPSARLCD